MVYQVVTSLVTRLRPGYSLTYDMTKLGQYPAIVSEHSIPPAGLSLGVKGSVKLGCVAELEPELSSLASKIKARAFLCQVSAVRLLGLALRQVRVGVCDLFAGG